MNRSFLSLAILVFGLAFELFGDAKKPADYEPQEGDIVFQSLPHCPLVDAIEGCTHSPFSHCGIVHKAADGWCVIEAIGPVTQTPLEFWKLQGRQQSFAVKRLIKPPVNLIDRFVAEALKFIGKPYDIHYSMDDEAIYCSELIYKAYLKVSGRGLGKMTKLRELDWRPPEAIIRSIDGQVPLDREMITPLALFEAPELKEVPGGTLLFPLKK